MEKQNTDPIQPESDSPQPLIVIVAVHEGADPVLPFIHALSLVCSARGELEIVDVRKDRRNKVYLGVRKTFEQWRKLPAGSHRDDVAKMGVHVKKIVKPGEPKKEIAKRLQKHYHDILVIGTDANKGLGGLFGTDLAEHLANSQRQTTLYIPKRARPFVNAETGEITLNKIIVPIAEDPSPAASFEMLQRLKQIVPECPMEVIGMHAGDIAPYLTPSLLEGLSFTEQTIPPSEDSVAHTIAVTAASEKADLIVMSTNGRDTIAQKIVGSVTEQVLRKAPCPVLAVATW